MMMCSRLGNNDRTLYITVADNDIRFSAHQKECVPGERRNKTHDGCTSHTEKVNNVYAWAYGSLKRCTSLSVITLREFRRKRDRCLTMIEYDRYCIQLTTRCIASL